MHSNLTPNWPIGLKRVGLYPIDYTLSQKCVLGSPPQDVCRQRGKKGEEISSFKASCW